jgi:hypothetical protein
LDYVKDQDQNMVLTLKQKNEFRQSFPKFL